MAAVSLSTQIGEVSNQLLLLSRPFTRPAASLSFQPDPADDKSTVYGLEHVIHRQSRYGHGGQGFHLDAGLRAGRSRRRYPGAVFFERDSDVGVSQGERMAERDQFARSLRGHNP